MHVLTAAPPSTYLVVVARGRLLVGRTQGLQLRVQDVQQLLDEPDGHADVAGIDPTPRQVDQLTCDVGGVFAALDLEKDGKRVFLMYFFVFVFYIGQ